MEKIIQKIVGYNSIIIGSTVYSWWNLYNPVWIVASLLELLLSLPFYGLSCVGDWFKHTKDMINNFFRRKELIERYNNKYKGYRQ